MKGMMIPNYLKIKKALENGDSVALDGQLLNVFDTCLLEKRVKECFCCYDFRLVVEDYKKVNIKEGSVRFSGSEISFCPFCGQKIKVE